MLLSRLIVIFLLLVGGRSIASISGGMMPVSSLQQATGAAGSLSYEKRLRLINSAPGIMDESNRQVLLGFLSKRPDEDDVSEDELAALKNDVAERLLNESTSADGLSEVLLASVADKAQGAMWQNYALQKLGRAYQKTSDQDVRQQLLDCLLSQASHPDHDASGTALIVLYNLSKSGEGPSRHEVGKMAYRVATDNAFGFFTQTTAIRIAAGCGNPAIIDYARELLKRNGAPTELKVAAVAALGMSGDQRDLDELNEYVNSSDVRLRNASRYAVISINAHLK